MLGPRGQHTAVPQLLTEDAFVVPIASESEEYRQGNASTEQMWVAGNMGCRDEDDRRVQNQKAKPKAKQNSKRKPKEHEPRCTSREVGQADGDNVTRATRAVDGPFHELGCMSCTVLARIKDCDLRHLDSVEDSRFLSGSGFCYPNTPSLIITASRDMGRSASTWVFNAVRLLFRQARVACDSYWMRYLTKEKLEQRLSTGAHVLVKTHEWTPHVSKDNFTAMLQIFTHVVVSIREECPQDQAWIDVATHIVHYEDIVEYGRKKIGALRVLRGLADHLRIPGLDDFDLRLVDYSLMTLPIPGDATTKFIGFLHARRGGRPIPKAPPTQ